MLKRSNDISWAPAVVLAVFAVLLLGFSVGFVVGDQRLLIPEKDQLLLAKGTVAGMNYALGLLIEDRDPLLARVRYEKALAENPHFKEARKSLDKLLDNPGGH